MESFMRFIDRTARCAAIYRSEQLESVGLNGYQYIYITKLCKNPGISQDGLAALIYVNKSNVARQLALLEKNGFVERRPSAQDRRAMEVFPTQKAYDVLPRVRQVLKDWNREIFDQFSPEEQELFSAMMARVTAKAVEVSKADGRARP